MRNHIELMTKCKESDDIVTMAADYAKWMVDYADMAQKMEALDDGSLADSEAAYYVEVLLRASGKLSSAAVST